ncbi:hypothetical protein CK203_111663 [Vitis vinifera]|uniref:J domain-containing protein n=1 Tax=Vitis vinifera TaxID=29760 RepID=A0A438FEM1_VITVI|nr:hypothetical protein CK203_111663 [Vitis vinifera]
MAGSSKFWLLMRKIGCIVAGLWLLPNSLAYLSHFSVPHLPGSDPAIWNSGTEVPETIDFLKIRYAFELLTDPLWKRDYDIFGIDEQIDVFENVKKQFSGVSFSGINLPLLSAASSDPGDHVFNVITSNDFHSVLEKTEPLLIQV